MIQASGAGNRTVVLVRFSSIGDLLLAEPLPRLLKRVGVQRIVFVTKESLRVLPESWPAVDQVLTLDDPGSLAQLFTLRKKVRAERPDLVLDLHHNLRSCVLCFGLPHRRLPKHRLHKLLLVYAKPLCHRHPPAVGQRYLALAGLQEEVSETLPQLWVGGERLQHAVSESEALVPGAGLATKCWPDEYWLEFARLLLERSELPLVVLGGKAEARIGEALAQLHPARVRNYCGELDLAGTARQLAKARRVICGDTGLMHMADAAGVPGIVLFGGTVPELGFAPRGTGLRVIQNELNCRPCSHIGRRSCPRKHFKCMRELLPAEVLESYLEC